MINFSCSRRLENPLFLRHFLVEIKFKLRSRVINDIWTVIVSRLDDIGTSRLFRVQCAVVCQRMDRFPYVRVLQESRKKNRC